MNQVVKRHLEIGKHIYSGIAAILSFYGNEEVLK